MVGGGKGVCECVVGMGGIEGGSLATPRVDIAPYPRNDRAVPQAPTDPITDRYLYTIIKLPNRYISVGSKKALP